ncbi:DNA polymerase IV [Paenibacillus radicis (ex Gao et al. 2016)]|uniref:DNA polymerase IV n=1 Tax=Paenibacillus radicis (ex Gao et al. 2016) TaxID=1737354 RepID=A0A917M7M9_9BACL|nr:DNA polymerase IV [Paenibacillus radicis (ex Gao et al. 2016)]GGG82965.1 DNA polymerase IV 2 [Paenibacillus radicis (ex Gao et al. 2016)]
MERTIMLIDCQSFYASVEKASHPEYHDDPIVVAGDPSRRSGIILAACPIAKSYGVVTAETLGEALGKCPNLVVVKPRMQLYIDVSLLITDIFGRYTDLVEPFSIDEQFLDVTGSIAYFGPPEQIAALIQTRIMLYTGVWARVGIGPNKMLAKMATDIWAKKNESGIFTLQKPDVQQLLWPLPVGKMFGVGSRMIAHFQRMGIHTIGDLGRMPLAELKRRLHARMGRNSDIQAELYWQTANGIDPSPVKPGTHDAQQAVGHQMTLPRDYANPHEIDVVLLELSEEVCRRSRAKGYMAHVVAAGAQGADFDQPTGFFRQMKVPDPTNITKEVFAAARSLFYAHWDRLPVRKLGVTLSSLVPDDQYQLTLFGNREKERRLERTTDAIRNKFGTTSILRASSLLEAAQARERSVKIGGHYK